MLIFSLGLLLIAAIAVALPEELVSVDDAGAAIASANFAGNFDRVVVEAIEEGSMGGNDLELARSDFSCLEEVPGMRGMLRERALLSMLEEGKDGRDEKGVLAG